MKPYERILVPTDFSAVAMSALEHAKLIAEKFAAQLHFLHVLEDPLQGTVLADGYSLPDDFTKRLRDDSIVKLANLLSESDRMKYRVEWQLRDGSPFVEIVRYAREQDISLIVMGTHGRGPITHMLLGSVVEKVVRKASCPVMVTRSSTQVFVIP